MLRLPVFGLVAVLAACSSSSSTHAPTECDSATERVGTYLAHYDLASGNCGPVDDQLLSFNAGPGSPANACTVNSERITESGCKIERDVTCRTSTGSIRTVASSTQQTEDGGLLTGIISFDITGRSPCLGTYRLTFTRQ